MPSATPPIRDPAVSAAFDRYPAKIRVKLMALRSLILATAKRTDGVGAIDECLKWNEPAYVTSESGCLDRTRNTQCSSTAGPPSWSHSGNSFLASSGLTARARSYFTWRT
jgi:hypothetical protein